MGQEWRVGVGIDILLVKPFGVWGAKYSCSTSLKSLINVFIRGLVVYIVLNKSQLILPLDYDYSLAVSCHMIRPSTAAPCAVMYYQLSYKIT